jgi:ParB family transcriptional regulator, chromosome partitioning protein
MSAQPFVLPVADVHVEPGLNARAVEEHELEGLVASIGRHGVVQPLLVRTREQGGAWLVAGHRRLTAARTGRRADGQQLSIVRDVGGRTVVGAAGIAAARISAWLP